jgi:4'-phosphopantetheinyl transferase
MGEDDLQHVTSVDGLPPADPSGGDVVVVCCAVAAEEAGLSERSLAWLSDEERHRAAKFAFERDRLTFVAAHLLLRRCLERSSGRHDRGLVAGPFGKPALAPPFGTPPLGFNLTHTRGLVACALGFGRELGIDAEAADRQADHPQLARHYFAAEERDALERLPAAEQSAAFMAIWTLKEAVIKATGRGLSMPLDQFAVGLETADVRFAPNAGEAEDGWLWARRRLPEHHLALAIRGAPGLAPPRRIRWAEIGWASLVTD